MHKDSLIHNLLGIPPIHIGREPLLVSCAGSSGASTSFRGEGVDGRDKPGHDDGEGTGSAPSPYGRMT